MSRTAREVVELYNFVVWNKKDFELAEELMGRRLVETRRPVRRGPGHHPRAVGFER